MTRLKVLLGINPAKPALSQYVSGVGQVAALLLGLVWFVVAMRRWQLLLHRDDDRLFVICLLAAFPVWCLSTFAVYRAVPMLRDITPLVGAVIAALCWGMGLTGFSGGFVLLANAAGTDVVSRAVPVVAKSPGYRKCRLYIRPWGPTQEVVAVRLEPDACLAVSAPIARARATLADLAMEPNAGSVSLRLGEGRFGWDWEDWLN